MLISVIIPTHDRAGLLLQTLAALRRQTHRPLQVIVVDDGSTDDTWARLAAWIATPTASSGEEYCRVHQTQAGPAAARNTGLSLAQGELIQFLDSDDRMSPDKLSRQAALLAATPGLDGAYCAWRSWFDGSLIPYGPRRQTTPIDEREMLLGYLGGTWFLPVHAFLFRRRLVDRVGPWDSGLFYEDDAEYLLRVLADGARLGYAHRCVVDYCRHSGPQVSRTWEGNAPAQSQPQSIAFRERICAGLSAEQRSAGLAAIAALASRQPGAPGTGRRQTAAGSGTAARALASGRAALVAFGRTPVGALLRRRFGDGLLAWLGMDGR